MFRKKSPRDELFLHFFFESSESDRFSIIYMIRIRFFGPGELIQNGFRAQTGTRRSTDTVNATDRVRMLGKMESSGERWGRVLREKSERRRQTVSVSAAYYGPTHSGC